MAPTSEPGQQEEAEHIVKDWDWWSDFVQREYYSGPGEAQGWDAVAGAIAQAVGLQPGMRLLDLGSGAGDVAIRMALRGADAIGLEMSGALVEHCLHRAQESGVMAGFIQANMFEFAPLEQFDVILSLNTSFGYGTDEQNRQLIAKIGRWLRPGGVFFLDVVTTDAAEAFGHWEDDLAGGRLIVDNDYDEEEQRMVSDPVWVAPDGSKVFHAATAEEVRIYRRSEIEQMLASAGLKPVRQRKAMARPGLQTDRDMLTTWVATKNE